MANGKIILVAAILFAFFALVVAKRSRARDANWPYYQCYVKLACNCSLFSEWEDCWDTRNNETQHFFLDTLNKCDMGVKLEYGRLEDWSKVLCTVPDRKRRQCFSEAQPIFSKRAKDVGADVYGVEESENKERYQQCIERIILSCVRDPPECE